MPFGSLGNSVLLEIAIPSLWCLPVSALPCLRFTPHSMMLPKSLIQESGPTAFDLGTTWGPLGVVVLRQWLPMAEDGDHCCPHLYYVTRDNHGNN